MQARADIRFTRRGFTLIEALTVAVVVVLLMSLVAVAASRALRSARLSAEKAQIQSLKFATEQFRRQFGDVPPLVDDSNPVVNNQPNVRSRTFLSDPPAGQQLYSVYSIPYYLMGVLDVDVNGVPLDGAAGPAMTKVDPATGAFARRGKPVGAMFTADRDPRRLMRNPSDGEQVVLVDRWGIHQKTWPQVPANAIRYYRWKVGANTNRLPSAVGSWTTVGGKVVFDDVDLRSATYAIVSAGPDGLIDDTNAGADVNKDNIVEAGQ